MEKPSTTLLLCLIFSFIFHGLVHASLPHGNNRNICGRKCMDETWQNETMEYQGCMKYCLSGTDWPLESIECNIKESYRKSSPACPAEHIHVLSHSHVVRELGTEKLSVREFISVVWNPCPYGISDVDGYKITILEKENSGFFLYECVNLTNRLKTTDIKKNLSVYFNYQELDYSTSYEIQVEGLPITAHRYHSKIQYDSLSCTSLNGVGSCQCGLKGFDLPSASIFISGHDVNISLPSLDPCFSIYTYYFYVLCCGSSIVTAKRILIPTDLKSTKTNKVLHRVYPCKNNSKLLFKYRAISARNVNVESEYQVLEISEWIAKITSVQVNHDTVTVSWVCAPSYYDIRKYEARLNFHDSETQTILHGIHLDTIENCSLPRSMISSTFHNLRPGTYSAQVREVRPVSDYFKSASWSEIDVMTVFRIDSEPSSSNIVLSAVLPIGVFIITLLIVCFLLVCCWRKGSCSGLKHRLPVSISAAFQSQLDDFIHKTKTVWVVWKADDRNKVVQNLHAENIRHFASFLSNQCGLQIILDQFELNLCINVSTWVCEKQKEADVIVFVCPNDLQYESMNTNETNSLCGNFFDVFKFLERAILHNVSECRFLTVTLPYYDKPTGSVAELLLKRTRVFSLMDDIEDMYFFIQDCPKANLSGRRLLMNVNRAEYMNTSEGKAIQLGFSEMLKYKDADNLDCFDDSGGRFSDIGIMKHLFVVKENCIQSVEPLSLRENLIEEREVEEKPCPPPPIIDDEDADESVFLINTEELLSVKSSVPHVILNEFYSGLQSLAECNIQYDQSPSELSDESNENTKLNITAVVETDCLV